MKSVTCHRLSVCAAALALSACAMASGSATLVSDALEVVVDSCGGRFSVTDRRSGREWKSFGPESSSSGLTLAFGSADEGRIAADIKSAGGGLAGRAEFRLDGVELSIEADFREIPSKGMVFPAPLRPLQDDAAVIPLSEGFRIPFAESNAVARGDLRVWHGDISMPFFGVVDREDECGWMAIMETPDDACIRCISEGGRLRAMAPLWMPEMRKAGYLRKVRFVFFDKGGYVAMAKRYRAYAKKLGLVKTFSEKTKEKERPMVERLPGSANVWYFPGEGDPPHAQVAKELREAGIGRLLWNYSVPKQLSAKELDRMERYALNEKYRIPLFELVYHDCVASHWYWYDHSNHPVCFWQKRDCFNALYGTAPMYIFDYAQWKERKAQFVGSWRRVSGIARDTGFSEMLSHRALNDGRTLQETRFSGGTTVTVDFDCGKISVFKKDKE